MVGLLSAPLYPSMPWRYRISFYYATPTKVGALCIDGFCLYVRLSVPCLTLNREWKTYRTEQNRTLLPQAKYLWQAARIANMAIYAGCP